MLATSFNYWVIPGTGKFAKGDVSVKGTKWKKQQFAQKQFKKNCDDLTLR